MTTKIYKVYGLEGHRQRASFAPSTIINPWGTSASIAVINSDITGTNEHTVLIIKDIDEEACKARLEGQLSDGIFENCRVGRIEEVL